MKRKAIPVKDVKDSFGKPQYLPVPYHCNSFFRNHSGGAEYVAASGELERMIYETGIRIVFEGITDLSKIRYYTLSDEEDRQLFSAIANRFTGFSPGPWLTDVYLPHQDNLSPECLRLTGDTNLCKVIEAFHKLVIDCYIRGQDFEGLRKYRDILAGTGWIKNVEMIDGLLKKSATTTTSSKQ